MISFIRSLANTWGPLDDRWYRLNLSPPTASGVEVDESVAMTYSAVWACTRILSATGSCLPWNLYRRNGANVNIAEGHPVQRILHDAWNDELVSLMGRSQGLGHQINAGNAYAEIVRDPARRPIALNPIHPSRVKPFRCSVEAAKRLGVRPNALAFEVTNDVGQPPVWIRNADMFHVPSMVSSDGVVGKGVIENARESIGMGIATEKQGAAYQKNAGNPSVAIIPGKVGTADDMEYYRKTWADVHAGPENRGKPAIVPPGGDVKVLSYSPEDSQFLETRRHNVEEIARWYGVPPHLIQDLSRATFNNIEEQGLSFVLYSLIPWLDVWDKMVWLKLLTENERNSGYFAKHNVNALLRGNAQARSQFYESLWSLGVLSIDEIREKEDMNPIGGEEGSKRFVQTSYTTLEKIGEEPEPAPAPMMPEVEDDPDETEDEEAREDELAAWGQKFDAIIQRLDKPPELAEIERRQKAIKRAAVLQVEDAVRRLRTREAKALTRAASKEPGEFFAWLDGFYDDHQAAIANELSIPLQSIAIAEGHYTTTVEPAEIAAQLAASAKEAVLLQTEIPADEWGQLGDRLKTITDQWLSEVGETVQCVSDQPTDTARMLAAIKELATRPIHLEVHALQGMPGPMGPQGPRGEDGRDGRDGRQGPKGDRGEAVTPSITVTAPEPSRVTFTRDQNGNIIEANRE